MIGSLQEFIGAFDHQQFLSADRKTLTTASPHRHPPPSRSSGKASRILANRTNEDTHINSIKFAVGCPTTADRSQNTQLQSKRCFSDRNQHFTEGNISIEKGRKVRWRENYVAEDKSELLSNFNKRNAMPVDKKEELRLFKKNEGVVEKERAKQGSKGTYLQLKGKLKQNHQLMRSLVRVQEMELINPRSFFEISFQNLGEEFDKIKLQPKLRKYPAQMYPDLITIDENETDAATLPEYKSEFIPKFADILKPRQSMKSMALRLELQKAQKWSKTRAKSIGEYQRALGTAVKRKQEFRSKTLQLRRKGIMKQIEDLLIPPKRQRKNSLRKSSKYYN